MNNKTIFFIISIISFFCMAILIIDVFHLFPSVNWLLLLGILAILLGVFSAFVLYTQRKTTFATNKYLFAALLFFPCLLLVFAGVIALTMKSLIFVSMVSTVGLVMSVLLSIPMLIIHLVKSSKKCNMHK
jgi:hypothetical protein